MSMFEAEYWSLYDDAWLWIVIVSFIIAFVLAFGIGANDVANSFGSSVGAKVLSLRQACILGTIFETLGAILIGSKVSDTIRKGIISVELFPNGTEKEFMMGNMAALSGSCIWMLVATFLKLPVSTTHSIVGATLGFSLVAHGSKGVNWKQLGLIVGSWFSSPILSGAISTGLFYLIYKFVLTKAKPLEPGLKLLPIFYGLTIAVNFFSIFYKGSSLLKFNKIPLYGTFILTFGSAIIVALLVRLFVVPWQRKKILEKAQGIYLQRAEEGKEDHEIEYDIKYSNKNYADVIGNQTYEVKASEKNSISMVSSGELTPSQISLGTKSDIVLVSASDKDIDMSGAKGKDSEAAEGEDKAAIARRNVKDSLETQGLFSFLQVLTAVFGSFAHGGNDVSNAIGPLVAIWITATTGSAAQKAPVPIWILLVGGMGISLGLWILGRRVMKTLGEDLTKITPTSGFCIEVGSALTVILASNIHIPISTTHCKVGSVVFVGWFRSREAVDWKLFRNIIIAWFVTLPVAGGISAALMAIFREVI